MFDELSISQLVVPIALEKPFIPLSNKPLAIVLPRAPFASA